MQNNTLLVRLLTTDDVESVEVLDDASGNYVQQWLEDNEDYAWGLFKGNTLIGYATTGYADDCCNTIKNHPQHTYDSLLLSDVYIMPEHRRQGNALYLLKEVIKRRTAIEKEAIFLRLLYDSLSYLYKKLGFYEIGDGCMVRDPDKC